MEPVRSDTTTDRRTAVELAKRLLVDSIWRTAKIEVDGVTFPDTQEIFDGRAPEGTARYGVVPPTAGHVEQVHGRRVRRCPGQIPGWRAWSWPVPRPGPPHPAAVPDPGWCAARYR